jgi:rhodanese-related sulfurtransferase
MKRAGLIAGFMSVFFLLSAAQVMSAGYRVIDHVQLHEMLEGKAQTFLLIDARNPEEYKDSHIPGAINIPQKNFAGFTGILPSDKNSMLVFYCNGVKCGKSKKAADSAMKLGYTNVLVYAEGMPVWEEVGYPFYKSGDYEQPVETDKLSPAEVKVLLESRPQAVQLVDVRDREEFQEGHIPGAINCPLKDFALQSEVLDKNKKVIVYCNSGGRSYKAYRKLMSLGYKDIGQTLFADWKEAGLKVAN